MLPAHSQPTEDTARGGGVGKRPSASVLATLEQYWGFKQLRSPQAEVIDALLRGCDAVIVLPTGYGKSLCFQLPAVLQGGTTLVISPLIALMEDQVRSLEKRGLAAAALHGQMSRHHKRKTLLRLSQGCLRLLYLSPETLVSPQVWSALQCSTVLIRGAIVDEAHTVADWGASFRPTYMRLGGIRRGLQQTFPIAAFTATANPETQRLIEDVLELRHPLTIRVSPRRSHINLHVRVAWTPAGRRRQLLSFVRKHSSSSGLIYARTRNSCRELVEYLREQGFGAAAYHGGIGPEQRQQLEQEWKSQQRKFLICTNAFGMGIDLPQVRWVAHFQAPPSVSDYVQEIGRAGRDGDTAEALTLVSEPTGLLDASDSQLRDYLRQQQKNVRQRAHKLLKVLPRQGSYEDIIQTYGHDSAIALALLRAERCLVWDDPFRFRIASRTLVKAPTPYRSGKATSSQYKSIEQLLYGKQCRWQGIERALGFLPSSPCGTCDNCKGMRKIV
ncbi:MAG: ATP-dependent DNA helicase RecQ [Synechococcus sp.]